MYTDENLEYAGFWYRLWAWFIDTVLLSLVIVPLYFVVHDREVPYSEPVLVAWHFILELLLPAVVVILFWIMKQATPGKMAITARVVDGATGDRARPAQLIGRYFAYFLSAVPLGLGFLWIAFDPRRQGWHDKLTGTIVVRPRSADLRKPYEDLDPSSDARREIQRID